MEAVKNVFAQSVWKGVPPPPTFTELISVPKNIADLANWGVPLDSIAVSLFGWSKQISRSHHQIVSEGKIQISILILSEGIV